LGYVYDPITDTWGTPMNWENATPDGIAFGVEDYLSIVEGYNHHDDCFYY